MQALALPADVSGDTSHNNESEYEKKDSSAFKNAEACAVVAYMCDAENVKISDSEGVISVDKTGAFSYIVDNVELDELIFKN